MEAHGIVGKESAMRGKCMHCMHMRAITTPSLGNGNPQTRFAILTVPLISPGG